MLSSPSQNNKYFCVAMIIKQNGYHSILSRYEKISYIEEDE